MALTVTIKETTHVFVHWRTNRLVRRKEKVDALHRRRHARVMSKRTARRSACLNARSSSIPTDGFAAVARQHLSVGKNFTEAIRLHQQAHRIEERNVEVLFELAKDLEGRRDMKRPSKPCRTFCALSRTT